MTISNGFRGGSYLLLVAALAASGPVSAQGFGTSLATADGRLFVGEPTSERIPGMVRVYAPEGGAWEEIAQITAPDPTSLDGFGTAVAHSGRWVFVSARNEGAGLVHVYEGEGDTWSHSGVIAGVDAEAFGHALAAHGNHVAVAFRQTADGQNVGTNGVSIFEWSQGEGWEAAGGWMGTPQDGLALALAMAEGVVAIGIPGVGRAAGEVHLYRRQADGGWEHDSTVGPRRAAPRGRFGTSVALKDPSTMLVGAPGTQDGQGLVHGFEFTNEAGWNLSSTIVAAPGQGAFGLAVAYDGMSESPAAWIAGALEPNGTGVINRAEGADQSWTVSGSWELEGQRPARVLASGSGYVMAGLPTDDFGAGSVWVEGEGSTSLIEPEQVGLDAIAGEQINCSEGLAAGFDCDGVDLLSFLPREQLGAARGVRLNDVWGWTDPVTGREYALVGRMDGTAFVDVTDPFDPRYLGNLAMTPGSTPNTWRDMKVFRDHMFVVADGAGEHGMQVFSLARLRDVTEAQEFEPDALYTDVESVHNIAINEETGFAYLVGASGGGETCGGGSHMVDITDPLAPVFAGCFAHPNTGRRGTGNSHDTQCVIYHGPDEDYQGREICMNANETALSISDVTDKSNPVAIAQAAYPNVAYAHQGWLTEDHEYFYSNDELDEVGGLVDATRTLIWDVRDLDDPLLVREYNSPTRVTDHNMYVLGDTLYMSNNRAGLRLLDISDPENPMEAGSFDTTPWGEDAAGFDGTWSVYPYFASGTVLLSSRREGLFLVKPTRERLVP